MRRSKYTVFSWVALAILGIGGIGWHGYHMYRAWSSSNWPSVYGTVINAYVRTDTRIKRHRKTRQVYIPEVQYTYTVNGVQHESSRICFGSYIYSTYERAQQDIAPYVNIETVQVYYNPGFPSESVLQAGKKDKTYLGLLVGSLMLLVGIGGTIFSKGT